MNVTLASTPLLVARLFQLQRRRIVDLEVGHPRRLASHGAGVQAGAEDDDLSETRNQVLLERVVEIFGANPHEILRGWETGRDESGRVPAVLVQKQFDHWISVQRRHLAILFSSELRDHESRSADILDLSHADLERNRWR